VHLRIDWQRRLDHMQQHTGQHLLSAVLEQEYGIHTLSFHLGTEYSTIDVSAKNPEELPLPDIEAKIEDWIACDASVLVHYCPPEDIAAFKLRKKPPTDEAVIRVVEIEGYDWSPCGGTHVERTGQLRAIKILSLERYKGNVRVYFAAGARAVRLLSATYEETKKTASALGVGIGGISARVFDILGKIAALERALKKSTQTWAAAEAKLAASQAAPHEVLEFRLDEEGADSAAELAKAAAELGRAAIAISLSDKTIIIQVPQVAGFLSLAGMLKPKLAEFGGKGGGGPAFFRASFSSESELARFAEEAKQALAALSD
jgi:alanyl-tRNA synthetase